MIDISDPTRPALMAYLPFDTMMSEPLYHDGKMLVPAGSHGIIEHVLDAINLLP